MNTNSETQSANEKEDQGPDVKWTVMIYIAADNDLEEEAIDDLKEMKKIGSNHEVKIVAQIDSRGRGKTFRFLIGDEQTTLDEDVVGELPEINTGDPRELTDFIVWGVDTYQAENYMLVLWGHGRGWEDLDNTARAAGPTTDSVIYRKDQAKECKDKRENQLEGFYSISLTSQSEIRTFLQGKTKRQEIVDLTDETEAQKPEVRVQSKFLRDEMGRQEIISRLRPQVASSPQYSEDDPGQFSAQPESKRTNSPSSSGFLTDQTIAGLSQDVLKMDELEFALAEARETSKTFKKNPERKIDILGMDACLMGMGEVGYQIKDHVKYLVASEDAVPDEGWPYHRILGRLVKDPGMSSKDLGVTIVREFLIHYREQNKDVTKSACCLSMSVTLTNALKELVKNLTTNMTDKQIIAAILASRAMAQTFYLKDYVDLYDFCSLLSRLCANDVIEKNCKYVMDIIHPKEPNAGNSEDKPQNISADEHFVHSYGFIGHRLKDANGVSIYFPCFDPSPKYAELPFAQEAKWDEFLNELARLFSKQGSFSEGPLEPAGEPPVAIGGKVKIDHGTQQRIDHGTQQRLPGPLRRKIPKPPLTPHEEGKSDKTPAKRVPRSRTKD